MMRLQAGSLTFGLNDRGEWTELADAGTGRSYEAAAVRSPLLSIVAGSRILAPESAAYDSGSGVLSLDFEGGMAQIEVKVAAKEQYATFEVFRIAEPDGDADIRAILWGPYATGVEGSIGESVGVVRDGEFAIGLMALNAKTIGGWPAELDKPACALEAYEGSKFDYADSTAWPIQGGSLLQAFARDRRKGGRRPVWNLKAVDVAPIQGGEAELTGTGIALFGCPAGLVLEVIEAIELGEGLPHPMLEGEWAKTSAAATQSYLITDFSEATIEEAVRYTKQAGLKYVYHPDPFAKWGHFVLKPGQFPDGDDSMRACVETAGREGVNVGVHTLSTFTTLNDPYVTPVPASGLQKAGRAMLLAPAEAEADELAIDDPQPFRESLYRNSAVLGAEIIEYASVTEQAPWKLLGVKRGANGTAAAAHEPGASIGRLWDHPYDVFFPDIELQDSYSERIAGLFRETGLKQISFDGLEGCYATGHDGYGVNRFVKQCYDGWGDEVINDASIVVPNFLWHVFTRFNWGEPWGVSTREGQLEWRLTNQAYFERNFIPPMLGWFLIRSASERFEATTPDEIEWVLSKAAGFGAGFALAADMAVLRRNGNAEALLDKVRQWESARSAGAFTPQQRERLRDPKGDWHLEPADGGNDGNDGNDRNDGNGGVGGWNLFPVSWSRPLVCNTDELQPGQPGGADWAFHNKHGEQPLRFRLRVSPAYGNEEASIKRPTFYTSGTYMTFDTEVRANEYLVCDGDRIGRVYDVNWNLLRTVEATADAPVVRAGGQAISFSCKFEGDPKPVVSVTVSTWGEPECVSSRSESANVQAVER
ncbi:hypothetical protein GZH47_23525 [Paenibacillus rhizovicinus]|uniref:Uncharacterized protein n=1 Tax=Paenibacillus rhizovicinus TaxID=2704463 RepID=A0A6C0P4K3_9BACL|nr:hypothetical protein [Paenibacillus rhizovicinus]QHW33474.1 hypothetical protein GZH47_23525 [Paenibacillus rhizovicinus]